MRAGQGVSGQRCVGGGRGVLAERGGLRERQRQRHVGRGNLRCEM
jgi:hypothetical protein